MSDDQKKNLEQQLWNIIKQDDMVENPRQLYSWTEATMVKSLF